MAAATVRAQEPLVPAAPLMAPTESGPAAGPGLLTAAGARRALELGMPSVSAAMYSQLLDSPAVQGSARQALVLSLVTAKLDAGDMTGAEAALKTYVGLPGSDYHLRAGLIAAGQRRYEAARAEVAAIKVEELSSEDRAWFYFLQGVVAFVARDDARAEKAFQQGYSAAVSDLQRARFWLARKQVHLSLGQSSEATVSELRAQADKFQGKQQGYNASLLYAVALHGLGRRSESIASLQQLLRSLPPQERGVIDDTRLVMGLVAGAEEGIGRNALEDLLTLGNDLDKQRVALQLLRRASTSVATRGRLQAKLTQLIGESRPHPILEELLVFRAELGMEEPLAERDYGQIEGDANALLERFPGSQLKPAALGVLVRMAWERKRYRTAATYAERAREALPAGPARAELGVLQAEAYFRAGDFRSAADGFASALAEVPEGVSAGALMFQRVQASIEAERSGPVSGARFAAAGALLDQLANDRRFDPLSQWQAEWNLARALQAAGQTSTALARVNRLRERPDAEVPSDLRVRMAWLQASLSFEAGAAEQTVALAGQLEASTEGVGAELKAMVVAQARLLQAKANLSLGRDAVALAQLAALREQLPRSEEAVYSYIVEANYLESKNNLVEAQTRLIRLADEFRESDYAPLALYQAALVAEQRGDAFAREAYRLLEKIVVEHPQSDLLFYTRLKQGDLLRKLNEFGSAQQIYESLVTRFAQHQEVLLAELALGACHRAQIASDASHMDSALAIFERLLFRSSAPADIRIEAGLQYGDLQVQRGNPDQAYSAWWPLVETFVVNPNNARTLGASGRHFLARILVRTAELLEQRGQTKDARNAYQLLIDSGLPGAEFVRSRLARPTGG